jgi:hypothetical protein
MPRYSSKAISILVLISIFMIGVVPALSQAESPEVQPASQGTLANFVYLPMVADLNPWLHPMAVETHHDLIDGSLITTRLGELSAGWVRLSARVSWRSMQPNETDPINWSLLADTENELRLLKQMGIKPVLVINDSPHWATVYPSSCSAIRSDKFEAYASFLEQLVNRLKTSEFDVHDWELGNEPEVDPELIPPDSAFGCWGEINDPYYGGQHYGEMLKYVAPRIRNADGNAKIWIGGLILSTPETTNPDLGKPENFIRGILEAGAAPYFDILPFHGHTQYYGGMIDSEMYLSGPWNEMGGGVRGKVKYLRDILSSHGVTKPLVINEIGVGCKEETYDFCNPPVEEFYEFKADMLVRIATRVLADDVKGFTWYTLEGPGWRSQGLLDGASSPQQAFVAYQELNNQIQDTSHLGPVGYNPNIEAYAFQRGPDEILVILWTKENIVQDIAIPVASFVGARMRLGYSIVDLIPQPVGTDYTLSVGFSPIFLTLRP